MERTIIASFNTRHSAERAIEHLVQEHGIERTDIFVQAVGQENSAGGPKRSRSIEISVDCHGDTAPVKAALKETGAIVLRSR
jgi:hypothetical protein